MRVGSLFSGIGGLDLGLHRAGWQHVFFAEADPYRRDVLRERWPGVPVYDDVRDVGREASADGSERLGREARAHGDAGLHGRRLDLLCGGFPCQDLSVAGQRRGLGGDRSGLFFEFARIIDALRPRWLLIENVPGLFSSQGGRDFGVVLGTLADLGYGVGWRILDSRYFGVPQRRRRVFIVGALADGDPRAAAERAGEVLAVGSRCERHPATRGEAREDAADASTVSTLAGSGKSGGWRIGADEAAGGQLVANGLVKRYGKGTDSDATDTLIADTVRSHPRPGSNSNGNIVAASLTSGSHPNSNAPGRRKEDDVNLVAGPLGGGNNGAGRRSEDDPNRVTGASVRRLTPAECERLQGLPDGWTQLGATPDSKRYAALGDAVTANVAEWIGRRLMAASGTTEAGNRPSPVPGLLSDRAAGVL